MKSRQRKVLMVFSMVMALSSAPFAMSFASGTPKRGEFPQCQEECLKRHTERMHKLADEYKATGNRLQYQDDVERQGRVYEACLDNCRQLYPVK